MLQLVGANTFLRIGNQGLAKMTVDGGTISNEGTASITTLGNIDEAEYRVEVVVENGGQIDAGNELHIGGGYGQATLTLMTGGSVSGGNVRGRSEEHTSELQSLMPHT